MEEDNCFKLPASQLLKKLETLTMRHLTLEDEDNSMHHLLSVMEDRSDMNDIPGVMQLNLGMLSSYELPQKKTVDSKFYPTAVVTFTRLHTLRLCKACLDQQNGPDERGKLDVDYFIQSIPKWQRLRTIELPGLGLTAKDAGDILEASINCLSLRNVDLSENFLQSLPDLVRMKDVKCRLHRLNLSSNSFGGFDDYESTCSALQALLSQYTSLNALDLSGNCLCNLHDPAIESVLSTCTHLEELNLSDNEWGATVGHDIRTAWVGQGPDFLLRR
jgi:Leucine-rich repeat (LRR) protein